MVSHVGSQSVVEMLNLKVILKYSSFINETCYT